MKKLADITRILRKFQKEYGVPIADSEQGSESWFTAKLGVISASNAHKAVAKEDSETRFSYMAELIAQVCTGLHQDVNAKQLEWGKQHEDAARATFEFQSGKKVIRVPFVFKDETFRVGCSPDGLVGVDSGLEAKCPYSTATFIKFLAQNKIKSEDVWQYQFTLWVMKAKEWNFLQYDPRMKKTPYKYITVKIDPVYQKVLDEKIPKFIEDMDKILAEIGIKFGDQWKRLTKK